MSRSSILCCAALAVCACSSSPGGDGGATTGGHGTSGGGSSGGTGGSTGGASYCDGMQVTNTAGASAYLLLYPLAQDVASSCSALVTSVDDAGNPTFAFAGTLSQAGGIWDTYLYGSGTPIDGLYPGGCDDVGVGSGPAGGTFTPPDAGTTVHAAVAAGLAGADGGLTFYGVVTFVSPWAAESSGSFYVQDPVQAGESPQPGSGIDVYVDSAAGGPPVPSRGDVVVLGGVTWSPYDGLNEFEFQSTSSLAILGKAPLPPPVAATAAQLAPGSTALDAYKGMRVVDAESFIVGSGCPPALQYTPSN
ncbi:MAG TPA: hypothetical protein VMB50_15540 [Myxococcales bacterium]|nr:hypothetical protein [Myxococcales bacterium]